MNNKQSEREIKKTISFIITSKIVKFLGISLTKEAKYMLKTIGHWRETEEDINKWES